jgi:conjugative relaxase-like TrwC/TraI family protein
MRLGSLFVWRGAGVLSVAKLTLGQEAYYEQQVARGLDDYYAGRGESPGVWAGTGSEGLGLVGVVEDDDLGTLLRGVNPADGAQLRAPVRERTITVRTLDVESREWREDQKRLAPVSGYDLVFSCPKSVSLLHALTEDERIRREVSEAHESAWQAAVGYLEREACVVRRGKGGAIRKHGEGFVAAAFRHRTSRAQDPHMHTHVIVANMARAEDGEWRALDGEAILKTYRLAAGYLYEAQLRHELTGRLGIEWTEPVKGMGELEGVPEEAIRAFSTRRQSLVEHMEALGTKGFAAARVAALATRETKEQVDLTRLREEWQARAAEHGLGRRELEALVVERSRSRDRLEREQLAARLLGPEGLTEKQATFTLPELVQAVAGSRPQSASVEQVLEVAAEVAKFPGVELVGPGEEPGRPARFTTRELLVVEREALDRALTGRNVGAPRPDEKTLVRMLIRADMLTNEQRHMVRDASLSPDRVVCVAGVAGAGKTSALRVLADAHRESGVAILGAAPSGRAADELQAATGIPSRTVHRLLLDTREHAPPRGCLLVVDEAGMAETRVLAPLLRLVEQAEGKALLVGDPGQLPAVGAGGLYAALCERLGAIELRENRRQRELPERDALARLRAGDPEPYLAHAASRGRLHVDDDPIAAKQQLLADWWQTAQGDRARNVMLAYRCEDVRDLNHAAHALMLRRGRLGREAMSFGDGEFRVGDRVLCRRNDAHVGVRNGTRGTIVDLDESGLTLRTDDGERRSPPLAYAAEHLDHGYALTGHAAQGGTFDRAFVLLSDGGALREWGYGACSRARVETHLYLADRQLTIERETPLRQPDPAAPPERAARALERSAAEPLAVDQRVRQRDMNPRLRARQQDQLDRQRVRAAERLAAAQRELKQLGWFNRGSRRVELEAEIALQRTALELAGEKRAKLDLTPPGQPKLPSLTRDPDELGRTGSLRQERTLAREPPGRGHTLELGL